MIFGAVVLYACGWDSTRGYHITAVHSSSSSDGKAVKNSRGGRLVFDAADGFTAGNSWEGRADREQSNERYWAAPADAAAGPRVEGRAQDGGRASARTTSDSVADPLAAPAVGGQDDRLGPPPLPPPPPPYFSMNTVRVVVSAVESYAASARRTLETDELAVLEGRPLQGKYIVLDSGNELANRLRGVLSGFFLGVLTDRVFVADITYQNDATEGLLSALFEGPGYEWDLSKLSPQLRLALAPSKSRVRGGNGGSGSASLVFDMSKKHFHHWTCDDVLEGVAAHAVTLSTVVYPLPLLARNPAYASHPIFLAAASAAAAAPGLGGAGEQAETLPQPGGAGQRGIEALETLLTRVVLRPKQELRDRAMELVGRVRDKAREWGRGRGRGIQKTAAEGAQPPVRIVGIHARTYFMKAVSTDTLENNLRHFEDCAAAGDGTGGGGRVAGGTFFFVATDEAQTQAVAQKVWGEGCYFEPFGLPGSKLEGIKAALVDLLVMGSFDDFVMTPHSSFSELGATLSHTWLPDPQAALRALPNRPIVPLFPEMNEFERTKLMSLLDRRAAEIVPAAATASMGSGGKEAMCMRVHAAGMSVVVAQGRQLLSMFEAIEGAPCMKGRAAGVAGL